MNELELDMTTATRTKVGPLTPVFRPTGPFTAVNSPVRDWNNVRYLDERMFSDIGMSNAACEHASIRDYFVSPK